MYPQDTEYEEINKVAEASAPGANRLIYLPYLNGEQSPHFRPEKIPYKDILYIMKDGKNAEITGVGGSSKVRKTLQQVYDELGAEEFIFIDRGCIVNIIHVMQIKDGTAVLKTGENLAISRSHLQDVKEQINAYWGAHI